MKRKEIKWMKCARKCIEHEMEVGILFSEKALTSLQKKVDLGRENLRLLKEVDFSPLYDEMERIIAIHEEYFAQSNPFIGFRFRIVPATSPEQRSLLLLVDCKDGESICLLDGVPVVSGGCGEGDVQIFKYLMSHGFSPWNDPSKVISWQDGGERREMACYDFLSRSARNREEEFRLVLRGASSLVPLFLYKI